MGPKIGSVESFGPRRKEIIYREVWEGWETKFTGMDHSMEYLVGRSL